MKPQSPMRYIPLALTVFLYLSSMVFAQQTTLVGYEFNNNLNYSELSIIPPPTLTYHDSNGNSKTPTFNDGMIQTTTMGDYLELTLDTTGQFNMSISFDATFRCIGLGGVGTWTVTTNNGEGSNFHQIGEVNILSVFTSTGHQSLTAALPIESEDKPNVKIRIISSSSVLLALIPTLKLDNLKIIKGTPNISVFANGDTNTPLPHNADASVTYNTDFGNAVTVGGSPQQSSFFRIRNLVSNTTGAPDLTLNSITVTGTHASDFEIFSGPSFPSTIYPTTNNSTKTPNYYRQFRVRFTPTGDGLRTAEIHIRSNGNQDPYIIKVMGQGASCSLFTTPYVVNEFNPLVSNPTLSSNINPSWIISGTASGNGLYPRSPNIISLPTYSPGAPNDNESSWITRNGTRTVEFGGVNGIDVSGQKDVSIVFNVGAYSSQNNLNRGPNESSSITLSVFNNGSWSDEITLKGSGNTNGFSYLIANSTNNANYYQSTFDGNNIADEITNRNEGWLLVTQYRYNTIRLNLPASFISSNPNLRFRITAHTPEDNRSWVIDNVRIEVSNSEFTERTASGWTNGLPNSNKRMIIPSGRTYDVPQATGLEVCECEVKSGGRLNVGAESNPTFLQVKGKIIVEEGGILEVRTNSNLVQIEDDAVNSGNIKVNRYVTNIKNVLPNQMDYIYWSSPVSGQQLKDFSPGTPDNRFYRYEESNDYFYPVNHLSNFEFGKGYAIRAEDGLSNPYNKTYHFTGVPQNGTQYDQENLKFIKSADGNGYNLIGNPYPSNIDGNAFLNANSANIYTSIYFWHNNTTNEHDQQQGSGYYGNHYSVYNGTGGNPGTYDTGTIVVPNGVIKSGQGFIVQVKPEGDDQSVVFNNSMRLTANDGTFYQKMADKDRFWITHTNYSGLVNTILVGYIPGATDGLELDFDAPLFSEGSDAIYTLINEEKMITQGLEYPWNINDVIPVGVKHFSDSKYIIALHEKEGIFNGQKIYLKDKYLNIIHNLTQGYYEYEGLEGTFNDRFEIVFKKASFTQTAIENPINKIDIDKIDHHILISSSIDNIIDVEVFNLSGWSIYKKSDVNTKEFKIPFSAFAKQIIIVNVKTETGEIVSKKFILN